MVFSGSSLTNLKNQRGEYDGSVLRKRKHYLKNVLQDTWDDACCTIRGRSDDSSSCCINLIDGNGIA
jgi:hypothetical protein